MCRLGVWTRGMLLLVLVGLGAGCQGAVGPRLLSVIGLSEKPLVVTFVINEPELEFGLVRMLTPLSPYHPLHSSMGKAVGRKVVEDVCFSFQLAPNLRLGVAHVAIVSPAHYALLDRPAGFEVLAVSKDEQGEITRPSVLIVAANSPIEEVADLRGKVVAFGPRGDARTRHAGLLLLAEHGLKPTDLALEALPIPGSLKAFPKSRDIAQSVMNGSSDAGFIDRAVWESFADTQTQPGEPARDRLRVIATTIGVPDFLVVASPVLAPETAADVKRYLLRIDRKDPDALRPLRLSAFVEASPELLAACARLIQLEPPAESQPSKAMPGMAEVAAARP